MVKGFTYEEVNNYFDQNGCVLLSREYINNRTKLEFICSCGHKRISPLFAVKLYEQFRCKSCTKNRISCANSNNSFVKICSKMEKEIKRVQKYAEDFIEENYNQHFICSGCKRDKPRYLFPNNSKYKYGKEKRCKTCNLKSLQNRRKTHDKEQVLKTILKTCKDSSKKRNKKGRTCNFAITMKDILGLLEKQNNKCAYTGKKLMFEYNNSYKISIDRIDSSKGYTIDNIQLIGYIVNVAKSDLSEEVFLDMIKSIYEKKI